MPFLSLAIYLLLCYLALCFFEQLGYNAIARHLPRYFFIFRPTEYIALSTFYKLLDDLVASRVARNMQRTPILSSSMCLKVKSFHASLCKLFI